MVDLHRDTLWALGKAIHEAKIALCWGKKAVGLRDPWPPLDGLLPGDFGYEPQPWVDIAWAQARAVWEVVGPQGKEVW